MRHRSHVLFDLSVGHFVAVRFGRQRFSRRVRRSYGRGRGDIGANEP